MYRLFPFILWLFVLSPQEQYIYYYPSFLQMPNVGIAHYATPRSHQELDKVGAYWWFGNNAFVYEEKRAMPLIRPFNAGLVMATLSSDYNQFLLVGNEGEGQPPQDNLSPAEMADFITAVREHYPLAFLVCLNSFDLDYMTAVIVLLPADICQAWGIHIYPHILDGVPADPPVQGEGISQHLDRLCLDCEIWVTEIGACNDDQAVYDILYRMVYEAKQDNRVRFIFGYTTGEAAPGCVNMLDEDGLLLPNGAAFRAAVEAYP